MANKPATAKRTHYRRIVGTTPVLLTTGGGRWAFVVYNEGATDVYVGSSGLTTSANSMLLTTGKSIADDLTNDNWWAVTASGSGTVSGFEVEW